MAEAAPEGTASLLLPHLAGELFGEGNGASPEATGNDDSRKREVVKAMKIVRLKVTLQDIQPAVWRRLELPAGLSLHGLHKVLQAAFGWSDSHLHEFEVQGARLAPPDSEDGGRVLDSRKQPLAGLEGKVQGFTYTYDFGDDWVHQIGIEAWAEAEAGVKYPRCLAGARACPPEDCGGPPGYEELCQALADPGHERHQGLKAWVSEVYEGDKLGWEPEAFDLAGINRVLEKLRLPKLQAEMGPWVKAAPKMGEGR